MELDHSLHWLGLALAPGLASRLTAKLLRNFGSPEAVFGASLTELEACQLPAPAAQAIRSQDPLKAAAKELDQLKKLDRKSTRLNSSHSQISYAVFCLKKKKKNLAQLCLESWPQPYTV